ncbi:hypothetical protein SeLEV6574_g06226 [Synchytrium endobioticum]|uniref:Transcription initiation factor TFIID subunit 12 domain-containing protein n=1 Tax=Synchytrium endobioticum TaxID=286115 RepID=A0A507CPW4_9FUNG|nr:hypothetical protein SeLEV6574_g06226 [Synchytrium endobioticum]
MLIDVAHEFVPEITDLSSKLAHHRGSDTLMLKDFAKTAERFYDIRIPGFNDDPEALTAASQTKGCQRKKRKEKTSGDQLDPILY